MLYTREQVSVGHPDTICNQIPDTILSDCLRYNKYSHVAVEPLISKRHMYIARGNLFHVPT